MQPHSLVVQSVAEPPSIQAVDIRGAKVRA